MRAQSSRSYTAIIGLTMVLASVLLTPAAASGTDSDLKHSAVLKVKASNGYSILVLASSERADGRGRVGLIVQGSNGSAAYGAPATVTATRFEADLGALGKIALDVARSGREKTLRSPCSDEMGPFSYEPQLYSGAFEFHGEEGYTEVSTASPPEYTRFLFYVLCGSRGSGEVGGQDLPGARLRLHSHKGNSHLSFQASKNRPAARVRLEVETHEERQGISISRNRTLWVGSGAFEYDSLLRTATLEPPVPFPGHASFHRGAVATKRWTGDLAVDLPGRSHVSLTGGGIGATLVPACRHEGEGGFRC